MKTDGGFAQWNNYIEYNSKGDRHENLSPEEYLNMIKPYLRDLINNNKPTMDLIIIIIIIVIIIIIIIIILFKACWLIIILIIIVKIYYKLL